MEHDRPLMFQVKFTYKAWGEYMRRIALEAGIPDAYRMIIVNVARYPGILQKELADKCSVTGAAVSRTVTDMLRDGYIRRETPEADKREKSLFLTEKGESCMRRMHERLKKADARIVELLGTEKEQELSRAMRLIEETITGGFDKDA